MPLAITGGGVQVGSLSPEVQLVPSLEHLIQGGTGTLTPDKVTCGVLLGYPGTSAATYVLPTVAVLDAYVPNAVVGSSFDWSVINMDGSGSGVITVAAPAGAAGTGWSLLGLMTIVATAGTAQMFRFRKVQATSTTTGWTLYRLG